VGSDPPTIVPANPAKGSTWVIERTGSEIVGARYVAPPDVTP
jgi:hypothetical protein